MKKNQDNKIKISVVGLGYVGLPLVNEFGKYFKTIGYDKNPKRIKELRNDIDINNETTLNNSKRKLLSLNESFNSNLDKIKGLIDSKIIDKTNKITVFLLYAFYSEYLLDKDKKKILMSEYIKLSKDFLTQEEVKYFNYLLDNASKKAS